MYTRSNGTPVGADVSFMGAYEALLSIQANHIRRDIAQEIKEYEHHFGNLMRMAKSVHCKLSGMDMISAHFPTPELVDEARLMDVTLSFIEASNNILAYLEIVKKNTGLPSGGDSALETHVKNGQRVVSVLLQTYIAHMDAQYVPGKDVGLAYGRDIKLAGRHVLHKHFGSSNGFIVHDRAGGPHDHWHIDHLLHPLRRVPGTPWHKYFGNIQSDTNQFLPPNLFDGQASQQININMPVSTNFMRLSTGQEYGSHRTWFNMRPDREHLHPSVKETNVKAIETEASGICDSRWESHTVADFFHLASHPHRCGGVRTSLFFGGNWREQARFETLNYAVTDSNSDLDGIAIRTRPRSLISDSETQHRITLVPRAESEADVEEA